MERHKSKQKGAQNPAGKPHGEAGHSEQGKGKFKGKGKAHGSASFDTDEDSSRSPAKFRRHPSMIETHTTAEYERKSTKTNLKRFEGLSAEASAQSAAVSKGQKGKHPKEKNHPHEEKDKQKAPHGKHHHEKGAEKKGDKRQDRKEKPAKAVYRRYLDKEEIKHGLENGTLYEGVLKMSSRNTFIGFVDIPGIPRGVKIDGFVDRNRAFDHDRVIVLVNPKSKWIKKQESPDAGDDGADTSRLIDLAPTAEEHLTISDDSISDVSGDESPNLTSDEPVETFSDADAGASTEGTSGGRSPMVRGFHGDGSVPALEPVTESENESTDEQATPARKDERTETENVENEYVVVSHDGKTLQSDAPTAGVDGDVEDEDDDEEEEEDQEPLSETEEDAALVDEPKQQNPGVQRPARYLVPVDDGSDTDIVLLKPYRPVAAHPQRVKHEAKTHEKKHAESPAPKSQQKAKATTSSKVSNSDLLSHAHPHLLKDVEPGLIPTGQIVAIVERTKEPRIIGHFASTIPQEKRKSGGRDGRDGKFSFLVPRDIRVPRVIVDTHTLPQSELSTQSLYKVRISEWSETSMYPRGEIIERVGSTGDIESETSLIEYTYNIEDVPFSTDVLGCLPQTDGVHWSIPPEELQKRHDLRSWRIFSIDPATARDLDDALSVEILEDGNYRVGVHIADVSFFVRPNTALDKEAQLRSTSVYFVQKVIPMLPRLLCEHLCSLNPDVERFAFTAEFIMNSDAKIVRETFYRSVIRSCAKLTYDHAQDMILGGEKCRTDPTVIISNTHTLDEVIKDVQILHTLAQKLRARRFDHGALSLSKNKMAFKLGPDGFPVETAPYILKESNQLIEEFMVLANIRVAKFISSTFPDRALLRMHPRPSPEGLKQLAVVCKVLGYNLPTKPEDFGKAMLNMQGRSDPISQLMSNIAVKALLLAKYFCTNDVPESDWFHYGLSVSHYTHFTSPIRRYADLIVHRLLDAAITIGAQPDRKHFAPGSNISSQIPKEISEMIPSTADCQYIAEHANDRKYNSRLAQEKSEKLFFCLMFRDKLAEEPAVVVDIWEKGFTLLVEKYSYERRLLFNDIPSAKMNYDPKTMTAVYTKPKLRKIVRLSDKPGSPHQYENVNTFHNATVVLGFMSKLTVQFTICPNTSPLDLEFLVVDFLTNVSRHED